MQAPGVVPAAACWSGVCWGCADCCTPWSIQEHSKHVKPCVCLVSVASFDTPLSPSPPRGRPTWLVSTICEIGLKPLPHCLCIPELDCTQHRVHARTSDRDTGCPSLQQQCRRIVGLCLEAGSADWYKAYDALSYSPVLVFIAFGVCTQSQCSSRMVCSRAVSATT